jgi:small subunit ribosomal protein S4
VGGIRKSKKKYDPPGQPWQKTRLAEELIYVGEYGLRNKQELWRYRTALTRIRVNTRDLLALPAADRGLREGQLLARLNRLSLIEAGAQLDDVLDLGMRDILERRLQTQVLRQGLAKTIQQARQLVVHGHVVLDGRRVRSPGMILLRDQERKLEYAASSPLRKATHPERPKGEAPPPPPKAAVQPPTVPAVVKVPKVRELKEVPLEEALEPLDVDEAELEEVEEEEEEPTAEKKGRGGDKK